MTSAHDSRAGDSGTGGVSRRGFVAGGTAAVGALALAGPIAPAAAQSRDAAAPAGAFWPDGVRLPITISMMWEAGAQPPRLIAPPIVPPEAKDKKWPDLPMQTDDQYGYREGIPRLLDMFDRRKIKVTSFLAGKGIEVKPALAKEIADRGHECAAHGRTHTQQFHLARDDERVFIKDGVDIVARLTGQHPVGYNCQGLWRSENTLSILQEMGFLYHIDDVSRDEPFIVPVNDKPFVVMPYTWHLNDLQHYILHNGSLEGYERILHEEFEALYAEAETRRRMMVISCHDSVSRPARVRIVERFIEHAQKQKGVWFARKDELARFARDSAATIREPVAT